MDTATMGITSITTDTIIKTDITGIIIKHDMVTADEAMGTIIAKRMMDDQRLIETVPNNPPNPIGRVVFHGRPHRNWPVAVVEALLNHRRSARSPLRVNQSESANGGLHHEPVAMPTRMDARIG